MKINFLQDIPLKIRANQWVITLFLTFLATQIVNAQEKIKFQGIVKDSINLQAIPYARASFQKVSQLKSSAIHTASDTLGMFTLNLDTGVYQISVQLVGYAPQTQKIKIISSGLPPALFLLQPIANQLKQVAIIGKKPLISQQKDKLVYDVEQDEAAKGENISDVMRRVPMLSVDGEGNVQLNGQTNYKVLLNGRETAMFAQNTRDALKGFPGAVVAKIEVITSPSAKYDAEGIGGLINIITKKAIVGYNGFVNAYYSNINYQTSTNFSVRSGKFAITGTYFLSGNYNNQSKVFNETLSLQPSVYQKRFLVGQQVTNRFLNNGNLEMSYNLDSLQTIVIYGNVSGGHNKSSLAQTITTAVANAAPQLDFFTQNIRNNFPTYGLGSDFIKKFKSHPEKELSFRFNGLFSKNDGLNNSLMDRTNGDLFRKNDNYSKNREYTVQTDFIQPIGPSLKFETGAKFIFRDADANYLSLSRTAQELPFEPDASNSDSFAYQQQVYGGYGSVAFSLGKLNFRTGLRAEHTEVDGDFFNTNTKVKQSYTTFIPDFSVNTQLGKGYTMILGYTKRLQRPYINTLNPFIQNNDPLNLSFGNPELGAQTMHTLSWQNRVLKGASFFSFSLTASYSGNMITQYTTFDEISGVSTTQYDNIGRNREIASLIAFSSSIKKLRGGVNVMVRYNKIENTLIASQQQDGISGNLGTFFYLSLYKSFSISGSGGINRPPFTLVNSQKAIHYYQINFGCKFFKDKLSTTVNFNNFFAKWRNNYSFTEDRNFSNSLRTQTPFRVTYIGFTYNFGKLKENLSKKKGVKNDDLIN
ncbi:outer membrane beta-barrel protein [Pedobacter nanyangensis]|uniref:outer membrane beta-barrel protein n=1 Tax=Pedobacter nanyangensis TaxID=1562389 RepID=UPI000DE455FD|nr:outer membrane beta-barrel protein [Pedobacter nanyangensis]